MSEKFSKKGKINIPLIPLRGMVAFPSVPMSIEVSRERSVSAIRAAEKFYGYIMLVAQKDITVEKPGANDIYKTGVIAKIKQSVNTGDGGVRVILEGECRAVVEEVNFLERSILSIVSCHEDVPAEQNTETEALMREAKILLRKVASLMPKASEELVLTAEAISDAGILADFIAANILVRFEDKQKVLEELDPAVRLSEVAAMLVSEEEILRCEIDIQKKVRAKVDANQRDFYLREQMKIIQGELGDDGQGELDEIFDRIEKAELPEHVEDKLIKEANRLAKTPFGSAESNVLHNYLEECLDIPFGKYSKTSCDIAKAEKILNRDHDGLVEVKERILEFLSAASFSGKKGGSIICLVGPPGVGKTSVASSVAEALGRKYVRVSLGGVRDEADIRGHRKTYVGAMPGRIVNALQRCKTMNPLILLDEIDKLCTDAHGDPASALLEVLDSEQNKTFRDHFTEIPIDLSECFFIATANTLDTVPRPLIDRMEIIELNAYTKTEKLNIAKNHLIPKQLANLNIPKKQLAIAQSAVAEIIDYYTAEAGVRNLEREISAICRKATKRFLSGEEKISVKATDVESFLGPRKLIPEKLFANDEVGIVNGLAYTSVGGDMLRVEASVMDGSGKIELTGSLGDVIQESAKLAVSYVRTVADKYGIEPDFYKTKDIHIHFPEGAVPKDGPSAGVTIVCALVSALSGIPASRKVAMTGEISLRGRVIAIGGLREKTMAAYSSGIETVIIPSDNVKDIEKIDSEAREHLKFVPCKNVSEVIENALVHSEIKGKKAQKTRAVPLSEAAKSADSAI